MFVFNSETYTHPLPSSCKVVGPFETGLSQKFWSCLVVKRVRLKWQKHPFRDQKKSGNISGPENFPPKLNCGPGFRSEPELRASFKWRVAINLGPGRAGRLPTKRAFTPKEELNGATRGVHKSSDCNIRGLLREKALPFMGSYFRTICYLHY